MDKFFDLVIAITSGEKSALPVLRTLIEALSVVVVANYLFVWTLGKFELINIYDYSEIVNYILSGEFIFPILFLLFSYTLVGYLKTLIFHHLENMFSSKFEDKILKHQYYQNKGSNGTVEPSAEGDYNAVVTLFLKFLILVNRVVTKFISNRQDEDKLIDQRRKYRGSNKLNKPLSVYEKSIELSLKSLIILFLLVLVAGKKEYSVFGN